VREIRTLRSTWRGLETWHGRETVTLANERASQRLLSGCDPTKGALDLGQSSLDAPEGAFDDEESRWASQIPIR
jgi:hypothetical protein